MPSSSVNLGLSILFLVTTFYILVVLNKRKNKSTGNCNSKINKKSFCAFEEFMKNKTSFEKVKGDIYQDPFHREAYIKNNVSLITNWGMVERPLKTGWVYKWQLTVYHDTWHTLGV